MSQTFASPNGQKIPRNTLFVIGLPIGCPEDIGQRALHVLRSVDGVFAEDTRVAKALLNHFDIQKPCERSDAFRDNAGLILDALGRGESWALVSDAGTPGLSDPGAEVVRAVRMAGYGVIPIPGACAFVTLASVSGMDWDVLSFVGFLPKKPGDLRKRLQHSGSDVVAFYESPQRIEQTLEILAQSSEWATDLVLGKELTKSHERILAGTAESVLVMLRNLQDETVWRGEWCGLLRVVRADPSAQGLSWEKVLQLLLSEGVSHARSVEMVRQSFGDASPPKRIIYDTALNILRKKV